MSGQEGTVSSSVDNKGRPAKGKATSSAIDSKCSLGVLDFSFWDADEFAENDFNDKPRSKLNMNDDGKFDTKSVKLSNNHFSDMKGFLPFLELKVADYRSIGWIDLSSNKLTTIDPTLSELPSLKILYLHANEIKDLKEVDNLQSVTTLSKLSLHGNPIDTNKNYKSYVLSRIPNLKVFDFSGVTKTDKANATTWQKSKANKKPRRNTADND